MDKKAIGKRIRRSREKLSLSRELFSEKAGISFQFLSQIENATRGISAETLYKICTSHDISPEYILLGKQPSEGINLPAVDLINKIPPDYAELFENHVKCFLDIVMAIERKFEL